MTEQETGSPDAPSAARTHFHLALAGTLMPVVSFLVTSGLAFRNQMEETKDPDHRRWTRRLWALAVLDFAVSVIVFSWTLDPAQLQPGPAPAREERPIQARGIEAVLLPLVAFVPAFALGLGLFLRGRRVGAPRVILWRGLLAAFGVAFVGALVAAQFLPVLAALMVQGVLLIAAGLVVRAWLDRTPAPPLPPSGPIYPPGRAIFQGAFYLLVGAVRLGVVLWAVDQWLLGGKGRGAHPLQEMGGNLGPAGAILLILDTVVLAPIAEELLFRGILLPRLAAQQGIRVGLWGSAALFGLLHPDYLIGVVIVTYYGWVLGWARLRTGGLAAPIVLHMLVNGLATAVMLSGRTG